MLRILEYGNAVPTSFLLDPSVEFEPGRIAQLTVVGNQIMATVSDGLAPIGIIDDIRVKSFTNVSWNEQIIVPATPVVGPGGVLITAIDIKAELKKANLISSSFVSTVKVGLNANNGVITFPAGTVLNYDYSGTGSANGIRTIVNYTYYVPNIPGDDSTQGSGRVTVWYDKMFFQTSQFETNQQYAVNKNLFVSEKGYLTSRRPGANFPAVALCTAPPTPLNPMLEAFWL